MADFGDSLASECWKNAELLWGDFKHVDFGKVVLPFTLLRRLECVLEPTRAAVRTKWEEKKDSGLAMDILLPAITGFPFFNTSQYTLATLGSTKTRQNLQDYVARFSGNARVIFEQFDFANMVVRLDKAGLLYQICLNFAAIELHPDAVPDRVMSNLYEHLIRRFGAAVNEGAEDFMTPRDVVRLATTLVLDPDDALFEGQPGLVRTLYDPTCGTGGFLSDAMDHAAEYADQAKVPPVLVPFGQELEPETHAVCLASMLLRHVATDPGRDLSQNIAGPASTLSEDQFAGQRFNYCLANPPFGKKWEKDQAAVIAEHKEKGFAGRFGPGLPRISDGSMLFLLHLASKLERPEQGGGRAAIVLSGSPLFNGGAGSGESEIRRWLLERDLVEAIVALPGEIFFRTGIGTYIWILSNRKPAARKGRVQLIDATSDAFFTAIKNEGNKRRQISDAQIAEIARIYAASDDGAYSKVIDYRTFGYRRVRVLRPLRVTLHITAATLSALDDENAWKKLSAEQRANWLKVLNGQLDTVHPYGWATDFVAQTVKMGDYGKGTKTFVDALTKALGVRDPAGEPVTDGNGGYLEDKDLTDYENVPLMQDVGDYLRREVLPHVPDAYVDSSYTDEQDGRIGRVGYEINFNRYFYQYTPPRPLEAIDADLKQVEAEIAALLQDVAE